MAKMWHETFSIILNYFFIRIFFPAKRIKCWSNVTRLTDRWDGWMINELVFTLLVEWTNKSFNEITLVLKFTLWSATCEVLYFWFICLWCYWWVTNWRQSGNLDVLFRWQLEFFERISINFTGYAPNRVYQFCLNFLLHFR